MADPQVAALRRQSNRAQFPSPGLHEDDGINVEAGPSPASTAGPSSVSIAASSLTSDNARGSYALAIENEKLKSRISELNTAAAAHKPKGTGKHAMTKRKRIGMTTTDLVNYSNVNHYLKRHFWPFPKLLLKSWTKYSNNKKSVCTRVISIVAVPVGISRQDYWNHHVVMMVNTKYCNLRSNVKERVHKQYIRK